MLDQKEIQARSKDSSIETYKGKKVDHDRINDMSDTSGNAFLEAPEDALLPEK